MEAFALPGSRIWVLPILRAPIGQVSVPGRGRPIIQMLMWALRCEGESSTVTSSVLQRESSNLLPFPILLSMVKSRYRRDAVHLSIAQLTFRVAGAFFQLPSLCPLPSSLLSEGDRKGHDLHVHVTSLFTYHYNPTNFAITTTAHAGGMDNF